MNDKVNIKEWSNGNEISIAINNNHGVGFYRHDKTSVGPRRYNNRFSITTFRDFAKDGELDNAVEYAKNYGIANLPVEVQALVRSWA